MMCVPGSRFAPSPDRDARASAQLAAGSDLRARVRGRWQDSGCAPPRFAALPNHHCALSLPHRRVDPITDLVDLLDRTLPELRITKHMFVSDKAASELAGCDHDGRTESMTSRPGAKGGHASPLAVLHALICHAGPHVHSLTLLAFKEPTCARPLVRIPFPQLQILMLEVLGDSCHANRLIMPCVHIVTLSMSHTLNSSWLSMVETLPLEFPALERAHVHGPQACWERALNLQSWVSDGPEHICYDSYPSVPRVDEQTSSVARQVADFKRRVAELDRPQNNVRFHAPQEFQWASHYATWRGMWAETADFFPCELCTTTRVRPLTKTS